MDLMRSWKRDIYTVALDWLRKKHFVERKKKKLFYTETLCERICCNSVSSRQWTFTWHYSWKDWASHVGSSLLSSEGINERGWMGVFYKAAATRGKKKCWHPLNTFLLSTLFFYLWLDGKKTEKDIWDLNFYSPICPGRIWNVNKCQMFTQHTGRGGGCPWTRSDLKQ